MEPTKLEKYAEIQAMVRKEARDIATQVYKELGTKFGVPSVPLHVHNGSDAPKIPSSSMANFISIDGTPGGVFSQSILAGQFVNTQNGIFPNPPTTYIQQVPIIYGFGVGAASAFNGGTATNGTMLIFNNGATTQLWVMVDDAWRGVDLPLT